ncbi:glycoside hydrolase family 99-like domain-containing protein [Limibaculum sp. FT325]|uniref:glycoside hydrolase family 99-like domain-containing protein n=1 Tax=Thermohalobaculum sediminis TaxID=2939436 RepID=UPI0020BE9749|nr:glycoside hydrolase family 99-like domain-containing protein [Limibaculum sediminis]MCL5777445.1 glycoside hydrolase family 99-like domain-containing protein [Limibaculum sediminis]
MKRTPVEFPNPDEKLTFTGERYVSGHEGPTQHAHYHRYLFALQFCSGKDVLDVACGEGYGASLLASAASSVAGLDVDGETIAFARRNYDRDNLTFRQGDATRMPFDNGSFDVVVSFETIEHFAEHEAFLAEIRRVLRPRGLLIISSPNRPIYSDKPGYDNPFHVRELDFGQFDELLKTHFKHVQMLGQRKICGSYLVPQEADGSDLALFDTEDGLRYAHEDGFWSSEYFVALASDSALEQTAGSLLSNDSYVGTLHSAARYYERMHNEASSRANEIEARLRRSVEREEQLQANIVARMGDLEARLEAGAERDERLYGAALERMGDLESMLRQAAERADGLQRDVVRGVQSLEARLREGSEREKRLQSRLEEVQSSIQTLNSQVERSLMLQIPRLDGGYMRSLRVRLEPALRHPVNAAKRRAFRAGLKETLAKAPKSRGTLRLGEQLERLAWRSEAAVRHPFSSKKRRKWRAANHPEVRPAVAPARASQRAAAATSSEVVTAPAGGETTLHARLFDQWVHNAMCEYPKSDFVPLARTAPAVAKSDVWLIAYYLPQFHPIPENDAWWGKGFTEWRNVTRAYPHFEGHYQPRMPGELGYYDLRVVDVMRRQVELAKLYGISAFCFHFYWFGGKTLLETPLKNYLENKDMDLPFCLCWANENWSRRWDGSEHEILIAQSHSPEDDLAFLRYVDRYFRDERYLKIDGRPVLTVYRPSLLPDAAATVARWRDLARELGYPDLYLIATNSFAFTDYESFGFDALSEFPPHHVRASNVQDEFELSKFRTGWRIRSYAEIVETEKSRKVVGATVHPGIMTSWDNSARRPANGEIIHGATPALFKEWMKQCFSRAQANRAGERLVFVNAWNEWAEGTYLEPDRRYGYAFLDACASVVREHIQNLPVPVEIIPGAPEWDEEAKTVLLCSHHAGKQIFGGERSFLDVLRALRGNGFNVVVTLQEATNEAYVDTIRGLAQEIRVFPYNQWTADMAASLASEPVFRAIIEEARPDIVYVNTLVVVAPLLAARMCGVPSVVHVREIISEDKELQRQIGLDAAAIVARVARSATRLIANSKATAGCLGSSAETDLVPNVVDVAAFEMPNEVGENVVFGLISSNYAKKGIEDVVELARLCRDRAPAARFRIIGPLSRPLVQDYLGGTAPVPDNLEFVDYTASPQEALAGVNVVLNFSHFKESYGRTVLEGLAAGRPCIVYDWGALPELVEHGVSGFLVPYRKTGDAVEFVNALCDPKTILRMGKAARERAQSISRWEAFSQGIGDAVRAAVAAGQTDARPYSQLREERLAPLRDRQIDIVICVHNALEDVRRCLDSVVRHRGPQHRVILVDDGSGEETKAYLADFARSNDFATLHRNETAQGYTRAANAGVGLATAEFFVLLNSDTVVTAGWAEKLLDAVSSVPGAGVVGPLSNAASYQSIPGVTGTSTQTAVNELPDGFSADDMNAWCEARSPASPPCVPMVHGFCFGITREAWNAVGPFDEGAFPRGYGEENDFCFRAVDAGFALVVATHTYVFHAKSKSYSEKKRHELSEISQEKLYERHGRDRFMSAIEVLAEQPVLERLRGESAELWRREPEADRSGSTAVA